MATTDSLLFDFTNNTSKDISLSLSVKHQTTEFIVGDSQVYPGARAETAEEPGGIAGVSTLAISYQDAMVDAPLPLVTHHAQPGSLEQPAMISQSATSSGVESTQLMDIDSKKGFDSGQSVEVSVTATECAVSFTTTPAYLSSVDGSIFGPESPIPVSPTHSLGKLEDIFTGDARLCFERAWPSQKLSSKLRKSQKSPYLPKSTRISVPTSALLKVLELVQPLSGPTSNSDGTALSARSKRSLQALAHGTTIPTSAAASTSGAARRNFVKVRNSHDNCSACLGPGELLCCDTCPRVFHLSCSRGFSEADVPPGFWQCQRCAFLISESAATSAYSLSEVSSRNSSLEPMESSFSLYQDNIFGTMAEEVSRRKDQEFLKKRKREDLFDPIMKILDSMTPRVFELPTQFFNMYEDVLAHPAHGGFIDLRTTKVEVIPSSEGTFVVSLVLARPSVDVPRFNEESSCHAMRPCCHGCGKTNMRISQTSFMSSYTVTQPRRSGTNHLNLQSQRSELIQCDYCTLSWHLDCLLPPLATIPPELRPSSKEIVDPAEWQRIKSAVWMGSPLNDLCSMTVLDTPSLSGHHSDESSSSTYKERHLNPPRQPEFSIQLWLRWILDYSMGPNIFLFVKSGCVPAMPTGCFQNAAAEPVAQNDEAGSSDIPRFLDMNTEDDISHPRPSAAAKGVYILNSDLGRYAASTSTEYTNLGHILIDNTTATDELFRSIYTARCANDVDTLDLLLGVNYQISESRIASDFLACIQKSTRTKKFKLVAGVGRDGVVGDQVVLCDKVLQHKFAEYDQTFFTDARRVYNDSRRTTSLNSNTGAIGKTTDRLHVLSHDRHGVVGSVTTKNAAHTDGRDLKPSVVDASEIRDWLGAYRMG
ncbi:hypothetical protein BSLG_009717 [Batrachochytrium salamandrivorans]|nr:hypothetical protein BSLG_009717 [Batrachochytrium salamandrivorans]